MIEISTITFFIVITLIFIAFIGSSFYLLRLQSESKQREANKKELEQHYADLQKAFQDQGQVLIQEKALKVMVEKDYAILDTKYTDLKEQYEQYKLDQKLMEDRFENLANQVLASKSEHFDEQQRKGLTEILGPLKERIQTFESKVEITSKEAIARDAALKEQIRNLSETGDKMSQETINLTKALKGDVKQQGTWGEIILENILERSGLEKGREYQVQASRMSANQRQQRPDITLYTPDKRVLIIDSKVSLKAYEQVISAGSEEEENQLLKAHWRSVRNHVDELAGKAYHELYQEECPDFVMMFVPIDHAFALALKVDGDLHTYAFEKNIVIVTPGTLLASLKTIESLWKNEKQREHALEIASEAGKMYDKFVGFCEDLIEIGKRMKQTNTAYDNAMNKLTEGRGNLVSKAERLKAMGAKANKALPLASEDHYQNEIEAA
jgi:DNA recombination protein RmuC